jgi:sentrin-specific protease 1
LAARDERICESETGRKRSHFFNSFFFQNLFDEKNIDQKLRGRYNYKNVANWGKKVPGGDIFNLKYIFIPRNVGNVHWTSACIFVELKMIVYFDSRHENDRNLMHGLLQYLMDEWKNTRMNQVMNWDEWNLVACPVDTPYQSNSVDCGAFTCMYADFITNDCKPIFGEQHMEHFRRYIALSILNEIATRGTEDYSRGEDGSSDEP